MNDSHDESADAGLTYAAPHRELPDSSLTIGNVAVLSVRLLGIYCLLQAIPLLYMVPTLAFMMPRLSSSDQLAAYVGTALAPAIYLAVGVVLLAWSRRIALRVLGASTVVEAEGNVRIRATGRALQSLAFAVVGVLLFVDGASALVRVVANGYRLSEQSGRDLPTTIFNQNLAGLLAAIIKTLAGVWLFYGSRWLAWHWHEMRMSRGRAAPASGMGLPDRAQASDARPRH